MRKARKGESTKSETFTIRLTPKLMYGLELLARKQHRTLNGVVQWAIERVLQYKKEGIDYQNLWSADQAERIKILQKHAPHLLTYEEELFLRRLPRD